MFSGLLISLTLVSGQAQAGQAAPVSNPAPSRDVSTFIPINAPAPANPGGAPVTYATTTPTPPGMASVLMSPTPVTTTAVAATPAPPIPETFPAYVMPGGPGSAVVRPAGCAAPAGSDAAAVDVFPYTNCGCSHKVGANGKDEGGPLRVFFKAYYDEFHPKDEKDDKDKCGENGETGNGNGECKNGDCANGDPGKEGEEKKDGPKRRALPQPWPSPPFPGHEYQGYPTIGVNSEPADNPLQKALLASPAGDCIKDLRLNFYGWTTVSGNWSTNKNSNLPTAYWVVPNHFDIDQFVFKIDREVDTVQQDHIDWGFRSSIIYGIDYRFTAAAGWLSGNELLDNNKLRGWDPLEQYVDIYFPHWGEGTVVRVGRYISPPDIEAQLAPDNYLGSHSILFAYDSYTQTGVFITTKLSDNWTVQAGVFAGSDVAPWSKFAVPTGVLGVRWVAPNNNDSVYAVLDAINNAKFKYSSDGRSGHDNVNYVVATWTHRFSERVHTATESYYLWQYDAPQGGSFGTGLPQRFGGGGGAGPSVPGNAAAFGVLNYTNIMINKKNILVVRNEWWNDEKGQRTGYADNYTETTIGFTHFFNDVLQIRPEIGYYHAWNRPAFDLGTRKNMVMYGFDMTLRF